MTMSNVIDLEQRRKQRDLQPGSDSESRQGVRHRANAFNAIGVMLLVPSAALLSFVTYQAVRLQLMGDVFVIGLVIALAAYLFVGYTLVRFGSRPALVLSQGVSEHGTKEILQAENIERSSRVLEFPTANAVTGGLISIRCGSCASRYLATRTDLACPTCGRSALAG